MSAWLGINTQGNGIGQKHIPFEGVGEIAADSQRTFDEAQVAAFVRELDA